MLHLFSLLQRKAESEGKGEGNGQTLRQKETERGSREIDRGLMVERERDGGRGRGVIEKREIERSRELDRLAGANARELRLQ